MPKSWIVGGRASGEAADAGITTYHTVGGSAELDSISGTRVKIPEALTARSLQYRIGANTLDVTLVVTLRKNNTTDTALTLSFATSDADVEKYMEADVAFAQDDDWTLKCERGAGTGSCLVMAHGVVIEPDNASNTLSLFVAKSAGSGAFNANGTYFLAPFGGRFSDTVTEIYNGTESTGVSWESMTDFTAIYFNVSTGAITWNGTMDVFTRKNGASEGMSLNFVDTDDSVIKADTTNSLSIADGDDFNYALVLAGGSSGTMNIEVAACWLRNTSGKFLLGIADRNGLRVNANLTRYWSIGGQGSDAHTSETPSQLSVPFAMTVTHMQLMSDRERNTSTDSTATLRKNGAGTALSIALPATGGSGVAFGGPFEDTGSVDFASEDLIDSEFITGDGTNRDWNYIVYLAEAVAADRRWLFGAES